MFSGEPSGECCLSTMFSLSGECVSDKTGKTTVGTLKDPDSRSYVYVYIYVYISLFYINRRLSIFLLESEIESDSGLLKKIEREDFSFFSRKLLERWTRSVAGLVGVR